MGRQFIRQPNGKWAIWSSVVDDFLVLDRAPHDLFAIETMQAVREEYQSCRTEVEALLDPEGMRRTTQIDWNEALARRRAVYGNQPGFKPDPFDDVDEEIPPGEAPPISDVSDYFCYKLEKLLAFYWWYHDHMREKGHKEPPEHYDGKSQEIKQRMMLEHYSWLHHMFEKGKMTNPLCPSCKEIVEEEGQLCDECRKEKV